MKLTVQLHENGEWKDAFWVKFNDPENGLASSTSYGYAPPYVVDDASPCVHLAKLEDRLTAWGLL